MRSEGNLPLRYSALLLHDKWQGFFYTEWDIQILGNLNRRLNAKDVLNVINSLAKRPVLVTRG